MLKIPATTSSTTAGSQIAGGSADLAPVFMVHDGFLPGLDDAVALLERERHLHRAGRRSLHFANILLQLDPLAQSRPRQFTKTERKSVHKNFSFRIRIKFEPCHLRLRSLAGGE